MNFFKVLIPIIMLGFFSTQSQAQIPKKAEDISPLLIGETLPKALLKDAEGKTITLNDIISEKPTVLVFIAVGGVLTAIYNYQVWCTLKKKFWN